ncbi:MAG: hypothetical protein E6K45_02240 [Gammaproteobacteria bacterium]|nr:MAG: hypothetical protein E6K45_02240 [Gammaproteobacteria bacterium]
MIRAPIIALMLLTLSGVAASKDLAGVFEDAVHNDPVIRQADANRLAAREARPQAWAQVLPQLTGTASATRDHNSGYQDEIFAPPTVQRFLTTTDTTTQKWAVNLEQSLFSWEKWMTLKEAGREVAQAEANYQAAEQQLILRVAQGYFSVLAAVDGLEANQASLEAISRQLDQANKRFEVGLIAITDVQEAKAARDTAAAAVIAAKRTLATSEDQLLEITAQKYDHLSRPGADMPLKSPDPADESRWVNISLEQNLSLISSRLGAEIARDNGRSTWSRGARTFTRAPARSSTRRPPPPSTVSSTTARSACSSRCRSSAAASRSRRCGRPSTCGSPPGKRSCRARAPPSVRLATPTWASSAASRGCRPWARRSSPARRR